MGSEAGIVPEWASEPCIMGIDEAGRGPVLGCSLIHYSFYFSLFFFQSQNLFWLYALKRIIFRKFVSGPMVYGCLYCARSYQKALATLSFAGTPPQLDSFSSFTILFVLLELGIAFIIFVLINALELVSSVMCECDYTSEKWIWNFIWKFFELKQCVP